MDVFTINQLLSILSDQVNKGGKYYLTEVRIRIKAAKLFEIAPQFVQNYAARPFVLAGMSGNEIRQRRESKTKMTETFVPGLFVQVKGHPIAIPVIELLGFGPVGRNPDNLNVYARVWLLEFLINDLSARLLRLYNTPSHRLILKVNEDEPAENLRRSRRIMSQHESQ